MIGKRRSWSLTSSVLVSERVALVLGIVTVGVLVALFGRYGYDDPYITFRYARNLLEGNGFVYNVGQRTLSTTAPLYGLLLAVMGLAWPDLPSLASSLSALALVLAAALLVLQARAHNEMPVGLAGGLFLSIAPLAVTTFGSESCLYVASVLALSLIHISEPTRLLSISYAVFCLKKKTTYTYFNSPDTVPDILFSTL